MAGTTGEAIVLGAQELNRPLAIPTGPDLGQEVGDGMRDTPK